MSFQNLKKSRGDQLEKLTQAVNNLNPQTQRDSDLFWSPVRDKAGNAYAVIRFLPAPEGEDVPFVRYWDHGFKGPKGWYIEKSLTSLGQPDPMTEYNSEMYNSGNKQKKDFVSKHSKRKLRYVSNILVIKHPARPEDEGKVFQYRYGKKIFDMIQDKMHPQFQDEKPVIPFDLWDGANFNLKMREADGFPSYDKSTFSEPGPLGNGDEEVMEAIWKQSKSLQTFLDPKNYKSYDALQARVNLVFGLGSSAGSAASAASAASNVAAPDATGPEVSHDEPVASNEGGDDDDGADFFQRLRDKS